MPDRYSYVASIPAVLITKLALYDFMKASNFEGTWFKSAFEYSYGIELSFYPFLLGPLLEALWASFVDRRGWALPGFVFRMAAGWILLQYYLYVLWDYYYRTPKL